MGKFKTILTLRQEGLESHWKRVVRLEDCEALAAPGVPVCPECGGLYLICECPGPDESILFEYKYIDGVLYARKKLH